MAKYYTADMAAKDAADNKEKLSVQHFEDNVKRYQKEFDFLMDKVHDAVDKGLSSIQIMPLSDEEQEKFQESTKVVPDDQRYFSDDMRHALSLLHILGYKTNVATDMFYVRPDLKQEFDCITISW